MSRSETTTPNKLSSLAAVRKLASEFGEYAVLSDEGAPRAERAQKITASIKGAPCQTMFT
jgi:hypothetical protein